MNDNDRVDRLAFSIRKLSRWYDAAVGLCVSLSLVLMLCPFIVVYGMDDARQLPFMNVLWQSMVISLGAFPIVGSALGVHWYFRTAERVTFEETGIGFVDMLGRRRHMQWGQVTGLRYNAFLDALILDCGKRRVLVQNSFVEEPGLVLKFVLKSIPDSAKRGAVVEFLDSAFLHGRIETAGPWIRRFLCRLAYLRWGGVTIVPKL